MARKTLAAILMCVTLMTMAFAPIVAGADHIVVKGQAGPRASGVTWTYAPDGYGIYEAKIANFGLKWLVLDICDNTTGVPELVSHQRIRFASYNADPTGTVYSEPMQMGMGRLYEITATPNGPKGSYATVTDEFTGLHVPVASFTIVANFLTVFANASSSYDADGNIVEYKWLWGDGDTASGMTATHTYPALGVYMVVLTVVDSTGLTDSAETLLNGPGPPPPPVAVFTCTVDYMVLLVDGSASYDPDGVIVSHAWDFGDGSTAYGPFASHEYAQAGQYLITLTVTDDNGMTGSASLVVPVGPIFPLPPVASFTWDYDFLTVWADASSSSDPDGYIVDYLWDWGDGNSSTGVTANHTFGGEGLYTMTLTVVDNDGLVNITSDVFHPFIPNNPPVAEIMLTINWATVYVDGSASFDANGIIVSFVWDFGDGTTATGITATHTYSYGGTYTITLVVTDNGGATGSQSMDIIVYPIDGMPIASFTKVESGLTVDFDASGSYDRNGLIVSYAWDWGDGTTGSGILASHTYAEAGLYTVTLTVVDNDGLADSASASVIATA